MQEIVQEGFREIDDLFGNAKKMKIRYLAGPTAEWMAPMQRLLGEKAFEAVMAKMQKIK